MIGVLDEPIEHLPPEDLIMRRRERLDAQVAQDGPKSVPLASMRQVKARLRQYSFTHRELIWRERLQMIHRLPMLPVTGVAQCDQRSRVDEDHGRAGLRRD